MFEFFQYTEVALIFPDRFFNREWSLPHVMQKICNYKLFMIGNIISHEPLL